MIQAKIENRAPEKVVASEGTPTPEVINIMAALKESMEAKGRAKVREAVRKKHEQGSTQAPASATKRVPVKERITTHGLLRKSPAAVPGFLPLPFPRTSSRDVTA